MSEKYNVPLDLKSNNSLSLIIRMIKPYSTIIEFGPAYGRLTKYLKEEMHCNVYTVEIDEEASKVCSQYAVKSFTGNIEEYSWLEEFRDIQFDYAVFADVLEHLYDPRTVLEKVKQLLRLDGSIVVSVPNIAHNSIIIDLMNNKFEYREVGLLDNTHIRFFTKNTLDTMLMDAGYHIEKSYATYSPTPSTEFKNNYVDVLDIPSYTWKTRDYGEIYQFVYKAKASCEYVLEEDAFLLPTLQHYWIQLYVDYGSSYSEAMSYKKYFKPTGQVHIVFDLPKQESNKISSIRIDPLNESCILVLDKLTTIDHDGITKEFSVVSSNADYAIGNLYCFNHADAQLYFDINSENIVQIELEAGFIFYDTDSVKITTQIVSKIDTTYRKEIDKYWAEIEDLVVVDWKTKLRILQENWKEKIELLEIDLEDQISQNKLYESMAQDYKLSVDALRNENKLVYKKIQEIKNDAFYAKEENKELQSKVQQLTQLLITAEFEKQQYIQLYQNIKNATFWKMTKPVRNIVETLKPIFRKMPFVGIIYKQLYLIKKKGIRHSVKKIHSSDEIKKDNGKNIISSKEIALQKSTQFSKKIKFSILVPLYNTPTVFLHQMIASVEAQTYGNWELCMVDGSDSTHPNVGQICSEYVIKNEKIRYQKIFENEGISGNTNRCIEMATGDYIVLFDHDDLLHPSALYEVMKAICDEDADFIYTDENTFHEDPSDAFCPHFKPDYSPDTLRSYNYICHLSVFSKKLLDQVGLFNSECDGSQDYDMILRLTEKAKKIVHIPKILYYWRAHQNSVAESILAKPYVLDAAKNALKMHLERIRLDAIVLDGVIPSTYNIRYEIKEVPLISIIIPNKDHILDLKKCIDSILNLSTYLNYEIVIIENNSDEDKTFEYYKEVEKNSKITIVTYEGEFNYSAINNYGIQFAKGDYFVLLNNDIEVISPSWLEEMLMYAQREDVGAVGAKLYYPDDSIQHAGVIVGLGGVAGHSHKYFSRNEKGYSYRLQLVQNLSAVTAACLMVRKEVWVEVNGLDENLKVAFNDIDFCMKIRKLRYLIVFTPYAELYHYESKSRGHEDTKEKQQRFNSEILYFRSKWYKELEMGDPYYNVNLTLDREDFSLKN